MKKRIVTIALVVALIATCFAGTIAYLTDTDEAVNTMTLGNVHIEQNEWERNAAGALVPFTQDKPAYPVVSTLPGMYDWDANLIEMPNGGQMKVFHPAMKNVVDKFVSVTNTGATRAYVRTIIAIEDPVVDGVPGSIHVNVNSTDGVTQSAWSTVTINGTVYSYCVFTYTAALANGQSTPFSLAQVFLDEDSTNEYCEAFGSKLEILALSQAVQAEGFTDAATALDTAFGAVTDAQAKDWLTAVITPNP